ncbi:aspartate aminotransferase family protein [Candidatus Parabeggiatoa sp. HSG14]|uniref:pyridoxal phosphate-dependent decarboxylase family protein n=1 Tax=Candidatus Parabeggiatoa sp. HSG14 TaxID=3055593 RepID=UPI0025A80CF6|nr:aspartate aminotransferase family protein [Thiotrichales bacterium HSG14]
MPNHFTGWFLDGSDISVNSYNHNTTLANQSLLQHVANLEQVYSGMSPAQLATQIAELEPCPEQGVELSTVIQEVEQHILQNSIKVSAPLCIAHLHCPPLIPSVIAETFISATNQSLDSWDQSPAATLLEQHIINWLGNIFGYDNQADGVFTSGGTLSNLMGLLLARNHATKKHFNIDVWQQGIPAEAHQFRVLCSEEAHFSVQQSLALIGMGTNAVIPVTTDEHKRIAISALDAALEHCKQNHLIPIAIVGTAGSTNFGSIDPLQELAKRTQQHDLWLHVDAAYGGAFILSDKYCHLLQGIELADSITVDFHKQFYQSISCGAFLIKDSSYFNLIRLHAEYLNPETDQINDIPNLVTKSLQTTKRFDALKLFMSLRNLGRKVFAGMIESTVLLAQQIAAEIEQDTQLQLAIKPTLNTLLFRYIGDNLLTDSELDIVNEKICQKILMDGIANIGKTRLYSCSYLKFTLLNPNTKIDDLRKILNILKHYAFEEITF